jgi:hypothetical protein
VSSFINYRFTLSEGGNATEKGAPLSMTGSRWAKVAGDRCRAIGVAGGVGLEMLKRYARACNQEKGIAVRSLGIVTLPRG